MTPTMLQETYRTCTLCATSLEGYFQGAIRCDNCEDNYLDPDWSPPGGYRPGMTAELHAKFLAFLEQEAIKRGAPPKIQGSSR